MSFSEIWKDPVWSKVIANFIWVILAAIALLVTGRRKTGDFELFNIIRIKFPAWHLIAAISFIFLANIFFPNQATIITLGLLTIILASCIWRYRSNKLYIHPEEGVEKKVQGRFMIYQLDDAVDYSLEFRPEYHYENNARVGDQASGHFQFGEDKIINIQRTNKDGRALVFIKRYLGSNLYRVDRDLNRNGSRVIQSVFEAKVSSGTHKLGIVAKKDGKTDWIHQANAWVSISNTHWRQFRLHFFVPNDEDFSLFLDDREVTIPGSIQIKNLEIFEPEE
jgi:hypothetical protein